MALNEIHRLKLSLNNISELMFDNYDKRFVRRISTDLSLRSALPRSGMQPLASLVPERLLNAERLRYLRLNYVS